MRLRRSLFACFAIIGGALAANAQEVTVKVGTVRSISTATILWGVEQGYFKDYGIKVMTETLDTAANSIALLAQNQLQLVEGGISAGYFNALEKNLPVTMVLDRVSSPLGHNLMLRPDLDARPTDRSTQCERGRAARARTQHTSDLAARRRRCNCRFRARSADPRTAAWRAR